MESSKIKRGRPKGSKNKKDSEDQAATGGTSNLLVPGKKNSSILDKNGAAIRHYLKITNHVYTELAKTAISNTELYNLYGIVVDSTTPHRRERGFKTHIKIIDPSMEGSGKIQGNDKAC